MTDATPNSTSAPPESRQALDLAHGSAVAACPFCGLTDKDTVSPDMGRVPAVAMHSYPGGYRIECEGCGCNGPWHHQPADAIAAWNQRPNAESSATRRENA